MTRIENTIISLARTHGGIVTVGDMVDAGFPRYALSQWAYHHKPNTLVDKGVYVFDELNERNHISNADMDWFINMYEAGKDSYFVGPSVLSFYKLALIVPEKNYLRSPSHKEGSFGVLDISAPNPADRIDVVRGIRLQNLYQAFMNTHFRNDYLLKGAEQAWDRNLLNADEYDDITRTIQNRINAIEAA